LTKIDGFFANFVYSCVPSKNRQFCSSPVRQIDLRSRFPLELVGLTKRLVIRGMWAMSAQGHDRTNRSFRVEVRNVVKSSLIF